MFKSDNSFNVLIGKAVSRTGSLQITDPNASAFIASGEIAVLGDNDAVLTPGDTIANSKSIRLVQGDGTTNPLVFSNRIHGANVTAYSGLSYVAPQEQIYYVGFNGTSGAIDNSLNSSTYKIRVIFKHDAENWSEQRNILYQEYLSDSTASQSEIAAGFVAKYAQAYPASNADIKVERVCDGTFTAIGGSETLTVAQGSTTVTSSGTAHALVAGDVVRIGGTLATFPVYVVASVSGATITLDSAYQGASGTVANANCGEMSVITSWGLKFSGKAIAFNAASVGRFSYQKVAFDLTLQDFGTTAVTQTQEASRGNGTFEQVAELEYFSLGFDGWLSTRNAVPAQAQPRANATSGTIYDCIVIKGFDSSDFGVVSGIKPSPFTVYIFLPDGTAQATNILAQLNPWMASTPRAFSAVSL